MIRSAGSFALIALFVVAAPAAAQVAPRSGERLVVHPEATAAIGGIKSPYCPGQMLETCPSPGAAVIRDSIQKMAEAGFSSEDIIDVVIGEYGEQWRAAPRSTGAGLWAWLLPPVGLASGLFAVGVLLARRRRGEEAMVHIDAPSADDEARIREAMKVLDEEEEPAY